MIYVDTSILSRLTDYQRKGSTHMSQDDAEALEWLADQRNLHLVTSPKLSYEIAKTSDKLQRTSLKWAAKLLEEMEAVPEAAPRAQVIMGGLVGGRRGGSSRMVGPASITDPVRTALGEIFDTDDADHIFQAVKSGAHFFLTTDVKTIIGRASSKRPAVTAACGEMKFVSPADLRLALERT